MPKGFKGFQKGNKLYKGRIPWNKGKHWSKEMRKYFSEIKKGKHNSIEHNKHISEYRKGKHPSEETKKRMSLNNARYWLGKKRPDIAERMNGDNHPLFGKHHSEETIKKMSGKNNHGWKGGITSKIGQRTNNPKWKKFAKEIYNRDNWSCTYCGIHCTSKGKTQIQGHHMIPVRIDPTEEFNPNNVVTLCNKCHGYVESKILC